MCSRLLEMIMTLAMQRHVVCLHHSIPSQDEQGTTQMGPNESKNCILAVFVLSRTGLSKVILRWRVLFA